MTQNNDALKMDVSPMTDAEKVIGLLRCLQVANSMLYHDCPNAAENHIAEYLKEYYPEYSPHLTHETVMNFFR